MAPQLARTIRIVVLSCYCSVVIVNVLTTGKASAAALATCVVLVLLLFAVQFALTSAGARSWPLRWRIATLGVQVILTYLPEVWFGLDWGSMQGPLGATVLLTLPSRFAWPLFGLVLASAPTIVLTKGESVLYACYVVISVALASVIIYCQTKLTDAVQELHDTRGRLAKMAVTQERLRFSRDLHDLLGYSLSTITLKGELVNRLIQTRPRQACEETVSLLLVARQALADVRLVSRGYRDMSLREEAESAAAVLTSADVRATVDVEVERLHPVVDTVLATVLREGVTNILRHSKAEICTIKASGEGDTLLLELVNDGVTGEKTDTRPGGGSGLGNLRARLTEIGGDLTAGIGDDGLFHLGARAPVQPHKGDSGAVTDAATEDTDTTDRAMA